MLPITTFVLGSFCSKFSEIISLCKKTLLKEQTSISLLSAIEHFEGGRGQRSLTQLYV